MGWTDLDIDEKQLCLLKNMVKGMLDIIIKKDIVKENELKSMQIWLGGFPGEGTCIIITEKGVSIFL